MKLLIAAPDYANPNEKSKMMYLHVRNLYYKQKGICITILNFRANENYTIDGIKVITLDEYNKNQSEKYDVLVCHAPNIRQHYKFLKKYERNFPKIVFFFHGHEVVRINAVYPKPYYFKKQSKRVMRLVQDIYDTLKLKLWKDYFTKVANKSHFVFVSRELYNDFLHWTKINPTVLVGKYSIIHNGVGEVFEKEKYDQHVKKVYDFITIRGVLDGSNYGIDIVNELAINNPELKFLVIGKGEFFNHIKKADNVIWMDRLLKHNEMLDLLNKSKCGLLPTRRDTQGVMTCEMATYGMPVITSNLNVCHEILDGFKNVEFISNENTKIDLQFILERLSAGVPYEKSSRYFADNTSGKEVELLKRITGTTRE
ncbi:glycosyltransferase [Robertmurraya andreesenii]|uniref:Glycosyltransferase involved in cell wall biosynthesis n=1 Tax=Anoxybacillus andreesenii TaxID=1325932 RepID=A0ABT9UZS7_9BACL|nr:glycosyltransferase [Robertmurraya andreesenii]MDQ0154192.1 glycosyltransferase involved in cell wall biosynthesis [Robertmurraya andreesenii]